MKSVYRFVFLFFLPFYTIGPYSGSSREDHFLIEELRATTAGFKGMNWADLNDNYSDTLVIPSGLSSSDNYTTVQQKSAIILAAFLQRGANTVRLPINPYTVSSNWWNAYTGAMDQALSMGMKVILGCWEGLPKIGRVDSLPAFWQMWKTVTTKYANSNNIYFEVFNEPFGYSDTALMKLYADWLANYPSIPQGRVLLDGTGYAQNVNIIGADSRFSNCLLSYHMYNWFSKTDSTSADWEQAIYSLDYPERTILTEFGASMTNGTNYLGKPGTSFDITYLQGLTSALRHEQVGSVYWPGLRINDPFSLLTLNGSALTTNNNSGLQRVQFGWGNINLTPPSGTFNTAGYQKMICRNSWLAADVSGGSLSNGAPVIQWPYWGGNNQQWQLSTTGNNYFTVSNRNSGQLLDVNNGSTTAGTSIVQNATNGNTSQQWQVIDIGFGYYQVLNRNSEQSLDVDGAAVSNGASIIQWYWNANRNQQWQISEVNPASSLLPLPQSLQWRTDQFDLDKCRAIVLQDNSIKKEAIRLQQLLAAGGKKVNIVQSGTSKRNCIELKREATTAEEGYRLEIRQDAITLAASTAHGIFNGLQTLAQLMDRNRFVQGCTIVDAPEFKWRGYMVDVGRNYQSINLLKQQIDRMARYKLNVFHFHLTEDVAWRLQIQQYPQLTAAGNMLRNKGKYYSIEQMQELIQYCKDRYITLVPEIDMPGHSKAFTRAMGVDMQSEKGVRIVKDIIREVCTTYDVPYLHIGADEVKITNEQFLPEITQLIRQHKKEVIGWAPGGNYDDRTIHQLWKPEENKPNIRSIDSRFLYISDYDPMNSVVTIFNRQLGDKPHGDSNLLGAEFCLWSDRRVRQESDLINMNPVYPAMLAFAERSWRGGGYPGVTFSIGPDSSERAKAFAEFENRLTAHKRKYFTQLPFNYVKQMNFKWHLFGPFDNHGDLEATWWPESKAVSLHDSTPAVTATGGTIWLRHTHGPPVKAWLPDPKENTTWYAYTRFWSNADSTILMWIDFKDLSKSGADATPPKGEWDYMKSQLWINGTLIDPPQWAFPGRPSGRLEEPLVDEGFYYRPPRPVKLKKGWNIILAKLPMGKFDPDLDWQVPPKWMFTVIPVHRESGINWYENNVRFEP